jgi:hypothetical protein
MVKITIIDPENPTAEEILFQEVYTNDNYEVMLNTGKKRAADLAPGDCIKLMFDGSNVCRPIHTVEVM